MASQPSKVKILFDSTADRFLDAESLIFLLEGLVKNVEHGLMTGQAAEKPLQRTR